MLLEENAPRSPRTRQVPPLATDSKGAAASTVYNPYKIFQAAQRCMGEPSVVANVLVELLGEYATQDVLMGAAASVLGMYYGKAGLRLTSMTDFGKFAGELAEELGKRDSPEASGGFVRTSFAVVCTSGSSRKIRVYDDSYQEP